MPREQEKQPLRQQQITAQDTFKVTTPDMKVRASLTRAKQFNPEMFLLTNFHLPKQRTQLIQQAQAESSLSKGARELGQIFGITGQAVDKLVALQEYQKQRDRAEAEVNAAGGDFSIEGKSRAYVEAVEEIKGKADAAAFQMKLDELTAKNAGNLTTQELSLLYNEEFTKNVEGRSRHYLAGFNPTARKLISQYTIEHAKETAKRVREDTLNSLDAQMAQKFEEAYKAGTFNAASGRAVLDQVMADGKRVGLTKDEIAQRSIEILGNMARYHKDTSLLAPLYAPDKDNIAVVNTKHGQRVSQLHTQIEEMNIRHAEAEARKAESRANKTMMEGSLNAIRSLMYGKPPEEAMKSLISQEKRLLRAKDNGDGTFTVTNEDGSTSRYSGKTLDKMLTTTRKNITISSGARFHPDGDEALTSSLILDIANGRFDGSSLPEYMSVLSEEQFKKIDRAYSNSQIEGIKEAEKVRRKSRLEAVKEAGTLPLDNAASPVRRAEYLSRFGDIQADMLSDPDFFESEDSQKYYIQKMESLAKEFEDIKKKPSVGNPFGAILNQQLQGGENKQPTSTPMSQQTPAQQTAPKPEAPKNDELDDLRSVLEGVSE